jgi:hypothetical protein
MTSTRDVDLDEYEVVKSPPWARTKFYLRKKRDRVGDVTKGELRTRIAFGESAMSAYGQEGLGADGLPPAASRVREDMVGVSYSEEKKVVYAEEILQRIRIGMLEKGITLLELPSRFVVGVVEDPEATV